MAKDDDGGSAFPYSGGMDGKFHDELGMTLRQYYAAQAIPAAVSLWEKATNEQRMRWSGCVDTDLLIQRDFPNFIAMVSADIAKAMLKEKI